MCSICNCKSHALNRVRTKVTVQLVLCFYWTSHIPGCAFSREHFKPVADAVAVIKRTREIASIRHFFHPFLLLLFIFSFHSPSISNVLFSYYKVRPISSFLARKPFCFYVFIHHICTVQYKKNISYSPQLPSFNFFLFSISFYSCFFLNKLLFFHFLLLYSPSINFPLK